MSSRKLLMEVAGKTGCVRVHFGSDWEVAALIRSRAHFIDDAISDSPLSVVVHVCAHESRPIRCDGRAAHDDPEGVLQPDLLRQDGRG
jgi:hypothetical protein